MLATTIQERVQQHLLIFWCTAWRVCQHSNSHINMYKFTQICVLHSSAVISHQCRWHSEERGTDKSLQLNGFNSTNVAVNELMKREGLFKYKQIRRESEWRVSAAFLSLTNGLVMSWVKVRYFSLLQMLGLPNQLNTLPAVLKWFNYRYWEIPCQKKLVILHKVAPIVTVRETISFSAPTLTAIWQYFWKVMWR